MMGASVDKPMTYKGRGKIVWPFQWGDAIRVATRRAMSDRQGCDCSLICLSRTHLSEDNTRRIPKLK